MKLLEKAIDAKINYLATICEIRNTLNILGIVSDETAERKNKRDIIKVVNLAIAKTQLFSD